MKILEREYDITVSDIKGYEKLAPEQSEGVDNCKLMRYIAVLDKTQYTINDDGIPEMTKAAQEEYDDFVAKIRHMILSNDMIILDEGYGVNDDELEWHVSCYVMNDEDNEIIGIMEIDTCVRAEE